MKKLLSLFIVISIMSAMCFVSVSAADITVAVSDTSTFNNAVANASTDPNSPTVISVSKNFNVSGGLTIAGTADAKKYIKLVGNGYKVFRSGGQHAYPEHNSLKGLLIVKNAEVEIENIELDTNEKNSGIQQNSLYVGEGAKVTLGNGAKLDSRGSYTTQNGMAVGIDGGTLIMNEGSKITSSSAGSESPMSAMCASVVYVYNGGKFIMNGGEISGNKAGTAGVIYAKAGETSELTLNGGKITNNTFLHPELPNYAVYYENTANYPDTKMTVGENMVIDGEVEGLTVTEHTATASNGIKLQSAVDAAESGMGYRTTITLSENCNFAGGLTIKGTTTAKKYIKIVGAGKTIKRTGGQTAYPNNSNASLRGLIMVENAVVELENVTVDAQFGGKSGYDSNCLYVGDGAEVTLGANASLVNGGELASSKGTALGVKGGTFIMNGGKISGCKCSDSSGSSGMNASVIYVWNNGKFIMNGGEISGNTAGTAGVIYSDGSEVTLNGGKIINNTFKHSSLPNYVIYNTGITGKTALSNTAKIEGEVSSTNGINVSSTSITGSGITFNADGELVPKIGAKLTFESALTGSTRHIGFIGTENFAENKDTRILTITSGEGTFTSEPFNTAGMVGNVMYQAAIKNVPSNISAEAFIITFE